MTRQTAKTYLGLPAAVTASALIAYWILSSAFVSRPLFDASQQRQDSVTNALRDRMQAQESAGRDFRKDLEQLKRIGCLPLTIEQRGLVECP